VQHWNNVHRIRAHYTPSVSAKEVVLGPGVICANEVVLGALSSFWTRMPLTLCFLMRSLFTGRGSTAPTVLFLKVGNHHLSTSLWMNCASPVPFLFSSTMFVVSLLCFRWLTFENDDYPVYSCSFCQFYSVRKIFKICMLTSILGAFRLIYVFRFF
jgi:hypothetical protein